MAADAASRQALPPFSYRGLAHRVLQQNGD